MITGPKYLPEVVQEMEGAYVYKYFSQLPREMSVSETYACYLNYVFCLQNLNMLLDSCMEAM